MITRKYGFGLGVALSSALVCLTYNEPALSQDEPAPTEAAPPVGPDPIEAGDPLAAGADEDPAPDEPAFEAPAEASGADAPAVETDAELSAETEAAAALEPDGPSAELGVRETSPTDPPTASGMSPEREAVVSLIGVEQLAGAAYPEPYTRGLKHGSLWLTFHGHQWPYMPQIGDEPGIRIGLSGYIWNDLSNTAVTVDDTTGSRDQNRWVTQTRGILRVTPTYNAGDDWFVQGNAEFVVQGEMRPDPAIGATTTTDDLWVRFGKWDLFDVTVGRYQAWEIANHYGMALDWATLERQGAVSTSGSLPRPTDGYGLSYLWDRQNFLLGTYALHVYPTKYLRAEILGHAGAGSSSAQNPNQVDIRPSAIFDIGWLKLKAGLEYLKGTPQLEGNLSGDTRNGYGFAAQAVFSPYVEFGGSFARGFQDVIDSEGLVNLDASNTSQTFGGFLNASPGHEPLLFGFGAFWNSSENFRVDQSVGPHQGMVDTNSQRLMYGAVQYTLWDRLLLKFVLSHASNSVEHYNYGIYTNDALSLRFRSQLFF